MLGGAPRKAADNWTIVDEILSAIPCKIRWVLTTNSEVLRGTSCKTKPNLSNCDEIQGVPLAKQAGSNMKSIMLAAQPGEPSLPKRRQCVVCPAGRAHALAAHWPGASFSGETGIKRYHRRSVFTCYGYALIHTFTDTQIQWYAHAHACTHGLPMGNDRHTCDCLSYLWGGAP